MNLVSILLRLERVSDRPTLRDWLVDGEGVEAVAGGDENVLLAVEHVGDRTGAGGGHQRAVPEDLAVHRMERNEVRSVAGEQQVTRCREIVRDAGPAGPLVAPGDLSG